MPHSIFETQPMRSGSCQSSSPLVSIITPTYNNAEFISECIESVRAQTYQNWDYVIVNNCSTDGTGEIARRFADLDKRIRVVDNDKLLPIVANHNHSLRQVSPASKYCKMVFSDDWLFPACIEEMVAVAEANPSVGIVGAYGLEGVDVKWAGLPYPSRCVDGREAGRLFFLEQRNPFGSSHSLLYRADLVRSSDPFFNEASVHADTEKCIELLRNCDFGFVHQVLTFSRVRKQSVSQYSKDLNTYVAGRLYEIVKYGADYLTPAELARCRSRLFDEYYNFLAVSAVLRANDAEFWKYHRRKLEEAGHGLSYRRLSAAIASRMLRAVTSPAETFSKLRVKGIIAS
jgi:glycosyltransferase involved in cell wall biosynthesis